MKPSVEEVQRAIKKGHAVKNWLMSAGWRGGDVSEGIGSGVVCAAPYWDRRAIVEEFLAAVDAMQGQDDIKPMFTFVTQTLGESWNLDWWLALCRNLLSLSPTVWQRRQSWSRSPAYS